MKGRSPILLGLLIVVCAVVGLVSFAVANDAMDPRADNAAVVTSGNARFTVLTTRLVRMEWSSNGKVEDHASLVFLNRKLPVPNFSVNHVDGWLEIRTGSLTLRYREGSGKFDAGNLSVGLSLLGKSVLWQPGMKDSANLLGTTRTLDGVKGATALEPGLMSRDGWVVVDDTQRQLFDTSEWPWVLPRPEGDRQDWYFFGYGHAYKDAMGDFIRVAGRIPVPPRFAFGTWWSRYWAYTDRELEQLVGEFRMHDVPLDVLVVDMDWHLTFNQRWGKDQRDQAGQTLGWTGYTWDRSFFPDPDAFLRWCEKEGVKTTLNIHPASGIQPHEEQYPAMAKSLGIDPATQKYVPFDIVDKRFAVNYFEHVIHPLEKRGIDFWWLDWQQWGTTKVPGVTPTWWLNYVFFTDMERQKRARPLLFHRWGGLGNHRYEVGFSGDTYSVWESLAFQPYFTATAANVGFGYWSHDIGGHMPGVVSPELYTRWIQFGAFSPILRTHTTKNPGAERRIWAYPHEYFLAMRDAYKLRYAMIPYIYTAARRAYDEGIAVVRPLYYEYPESPEAYASTDEYYFGNDMIVAPIATPVDTVTQLATRRIWLPEGEWIEWYTGAALQGSATYERRYLLNEVPVFVKAGAIVPMQPDMKYTGEKPVDPLILTIFPGGSGTVSVYEDEGNSIAYQNGECTRTPVSSKVGADGSPTVVVSPREGAYKGMSQQRSYELRWLFALPPSSVQCNGNDIPFASSCDTTGWWYDGDRMAVVVRLPRVAATERLEVALKGGDPSGTGAIPGALRRLNSAMASINGEWPKEWSPEELVLAVQTGNRIALRPATAKPEMSQLLPRVRLALKKLETMPVSEGAKVKATLLIQQAVQLLK
jgi:alpha-glucosidase (family GH31 glycosyl hydrolase)